MTSKRILSDVLTQEGIADLTGMWPTHLVEQWNRRLDPLFAAADDQHRSYVGADALVSTGIFGELFNDPVRRLIAGIQPSALMYHCHSYEIAAAQTKSHIHAGAMQGWHQDDETLKHFTPRHPRYLSIFILLTPVADDSGPFEFQPAPPGGGLRPGGEVVRLVGSVGTAAIWNRSYFHRAAPNRSIVRRRILKLSIQPASLANDRIGLDEFRNAFANLDDPWLRAVVDERRAGSETPLPDGGDEVLARPMNPSGTNTVTATAATLGRARGLGRRLLSTAIR
ncbi:MAG: phytanoyl-CoA dioxygenase family protein [Mycobacterium sp.]